MTTEKNNEDINACDIKQVRFTCTSQINASDKVVKNGTTTNITFGGFKAFTKYDCTASIMNKADLDESEMFSPESDEIAFETDAESEYFGQHQIGQNLMKCFVPEPTNPIVNVINSSVCIFNWTNSDNPNNFLSYHIEIKYINKTYLIPDDEECAPDKNLNRNETVVNSTHYSFIGAQPATLYSIRVQANNSKYRSNFSDVKYCTTSEGK